MQTDYIRYIHERLYKEITKGENDMNNIINKLAMNKDVYLVSGDVKAPVQINSIDTEYDWRSYTTTCNCRILTPDLNAIVNRRMDAIKNKPNTKLPGIKNVHFSGPCTVVIWEDKTKTIVRCKDGEEPDYEKGLAMAIAKKAFGTNKSGSNYYDIFKKWLSEDKEEVTEEKAEKPVEVVEEV